ncbi:MAG: TVP38/TMEM64 family protein [Clostridia bacterium]|nr:TVP38/TMEM64 family protein [Clostridia bacterium]
MPLLYILLQFLQVVVLPIPSIVSTLAGLALFGAVKTLLYSFVGIALGSFFAFWIGRKLGNRAVAWMVGEETLRKWQKKLKGKDRLFLTLMFLLPLFPDDILCFLAGLSTMGWGYFTFVILLSRALALSTTCFSVDFIPFTTWWGGLFWVLFAIILIVIFVFIYKNLDKIQQKIDRIKAKIRKKR